MVIFMGRSLLKCTFESKIAGHLLLIVEHSESRKITRIYQLQSKHAQIRELLILKCIFHKYNFDPCSFFITLDLGCFDLCN